MKIIESICAKICPVINELRFGILRHKEHIAFLEKSNRDLADRNNFFAFLEKENNDLIDRNNVLRDRVEGLEKRLSKIRQQCFSDMAE